MTKLGKVSKANSSQINVKEKKRILPGWMASAAASSSASPPAKKQKTTQSKAKKKAAEKGELTVNFVYFVLYARPSSFTLFGRKILQKSYMPHGCSENQVRHFGLLMTSTFSWHCESRLHPEFHICVSEVSEKVKKSIWQSTGRLVLIARK